MALTRLQMEILEFERATWAPRAAGRRNAVILERFGHNPVRHAQVVTHLIDDPAALQYDPLLVNRLRSRRDNRKAAQARSQW